MVNPVTRKEFELFRRLIEKLCGIRLGNNKAYLVEARLENLAVENQCHSFTELYDKITQADFLSLNDQVVNLMTTNETLWFRDSEPYGYCREGR